MNNEQNMNNADKQQLNIAGVSCWVVYIEYTTGCEADATSTEIKAVFMDKQKAIDYANVIHPTIKWHHYYQGTLEVEEYPFEPCN
jgi:hypothetical protein